MTSKILAMTDALGNLVDFRLLPGQHADISGIRGLIEGWEFDGLIADRAFDADSLRDDLRQCGAEPVIPPRRCRKRPERFDQDVYEWRHLVENFFQKLKEFKRIAMRSCKTDESFAAMIHLGAAVINSR